MITDAPLLTLAWRRKQHLSSKTHQRSPCSRPSHHNTSMSLRYLTGRTMTSFLRGRPQLGCFSHNTLSKVTSHGRRWWRIWAGHHTDAPVARTCGLLEAEEDHRWQLRKGYHQRAEVVADIIAWPHLLNDVIPLDGAVVLPQPSSDLTHSQRSGTLLRGHRDTAATWKEESDVRNLELQRD